MRGILFSQMEPPEELKEEFNDWYDTEHIPVRLALPGFTKATRYIEHGHNDRYLAIYEIGDLEVLNSPAYQALKTNPSKRTAHMLNRVSGFTRFTCSEIDDSGDPARESEYLFVVASMRYPESANSLNGFHAMTRHLGASNCQRIRSYKVLSADGGPWVTIDLYNLHSLPDGDFLENAASRVGTTINSSFAEINPWLYEVISVHRKG